VSKKVMKLLNISEDAVQIFSSPDKRNIKLVVVKISNTLEIAMSWLIDALTENKLPRTLLYCNSIKTASSLYSYIVAEIPECKSVEMYHSETPSDKKENILKAIQNPDSDVCVVIATSSLGMGVDCAKFYNVILYGPPKTVVDLIQEVGRVGRDGQASTALLLYNSFHLRDVESDVKNVIKSDKCRRLALLQPFLNQKELDDLGKNTGSSVCCDICAKVNPDQSSLSDIEKLITVDFHDENDNLPSDSSDDTISYVEDDFVDDSVQ
jgi:superfamily II DNA helicase RecQ